MATDFYSRLGVSKGASAEEIKKAYRALARKHHPDVNPGDKGAEERFKQVTEAFEVLSDPKKRVLYDEFGDDAAKFGFDEKKAAAYRHYAQAARGGGRRGGGMPFNFDFNGGQGFEGADFDEILQQMMGGRAPAGARRRAGPRAGGDIASRLRLPFRDAVLGGEQQLSLDGRTLKVRIPSGVQNGDEVTVRGAGEPGDRGGPAGDLILQLEVQPHPVFTREGDDLLVDLPITLKEAMFGGEVKVPTLTGSGTITVKPGTQSGSKIRLRGKGVVNARTGNTGDFYLVVQVKLPEGTEGLKAQVEALERAYAGDVRAELWRGVGST